ncbi:hypothetical protein SELMODRAFT_444588 [Selaginella moellendorffii]|uniref:DEAH11/12 KH-domain domain-containing protein n=1 Tax=Selaginella moellendorffii TaxID=88036 RepID=D8SBB2_SELML|nr:hypothetical protein SELMODRAFT_444588 [Selaginella moellendorffii]
MCDPDDATDFTDFGLKQEFMGSFEWKEDDEDDEVWLGARQLKKNWWKVLLSKTACWMKLSSRSGPANLTGLRVGANQERQVSLQGDGLPLGVMRALVGKFGADLAGLEKSMELLSSTRTSSRLAAFCCDCVANQLGSSIRNSDDSQSPKATRRCSLLPTLQPCSTADGRAVQSFCESFRSLGLVELQVLPLLTGNQPQQCAIAQFFCKAQAIGGISVYKSSFSSHEIGCFSGRVEKRQGKEHQKLEVKHLQNFQLGYFRADYSFQIEGD